MLMMAKHIDILSLLEVHKLPPKLTAQFSPEQLTELCNRLSEKEIVSSLLPVHPNTQKKMIEVPSFMDRFAKLVSLGIPEPSIENWITTEQATGVDIMDYPVPLLKAAFEADLPNVEARQLYLHRFLNQPLEKGSLAAIAQNIRFACRNGRGYITGWTEDEFALMKHPFLFHYIEGTALPEAMQLLCGNPVLIQYLDRLYESKVDKLFFRDELRHIAALNADGYEKLLAVHDVLHSPPLIERFLTLWLENGAHEGDLSLLARKLNGMCREQQSRALDTRLSYLALLYGGSLGDIDLRSVPGYALPVLSCALANRQKAFLRLFCDHYDAFSALSGNSLLYSPDFFSRIILNSLTLPNIMACTAKPEHVNSLRFLKQQPYTFAELHMLADQPPVYARLYSRLSIPRTDDRLTVLRQLVKRDALTNLSDEQLDRLALRLSEKPLSRWMEQEFAHIDSLKADLCASCLIEYDRLSRFLPDMSSVSELAFALRRLDSLDPYDCWSAVHASIELLDSDWHRLKNELELDDNFISEHRDAIFRFLVEDGANAALTYAEYLPDPTGFYRIVTAELMGRYTQVKYHADDLSREIQHPVSDIRKQLWIENTCRAGSTLVVEERDDFFTTLRIGEIPERTCLSYRSGMHRDCLLSCFDSNKKFLFATQAGHPVGRAMLRLTKGRCKQDGGRKVLEFADLRNGSPAASEHSEEMVLFLERPYIVGVDGRTKEQIMLEYMKLALNKALEMNARPVFSQDYAPVASVLQCVSMPYYLFISNSKGGCQYLDSLGGSSSASSEGSYRSNLFLIQVER